MSKTKSPKRPTTPEQIDPEAARLEADSEGVDLDALERVAFELDPRLVEQIRSRALKQITLRVGEEQLDEAKREAKGSGTKYQAVLRRWLAEGAARARRVRHESSGR